MPLLNTLNRVPFPLLLSLSAAVHLALIVYGNYQDRTSALKYTDVDYNVFTDAARYIVYPKEGSYAHGWVTRNWGLRIGDPYERSTYRYTPLLALLLTPNILLHPSSGKLLFSLSDLLLSLLLSSSSQAQSYTNLLWTLNPFPLNISTRGSSEALVGLCVISSLALVKSGRLVLGAVMLGLATHLKLYPFVYGVAVLSWLARGQGWKGWINREAIRFTLVSAGTFFLLGAAMYSIWGPPFIHHTYFYHLTRLDHRHNFSPSFYLTYLTYTSPSSTTRSGLLGFLPQLVLTLGLGAKFGGRDLEAAWAVQTAAFVMLNKVCTSQYFMWYLWFLPLVLPRSKMPRSEGFLLLSLWLSSQAAWLFLAFQLEFKGRQVYLPLWGASIVFLLVNAYVLGRLIACHDWDWDAGRSVGGQDSGKKSK